MSKQYSCRPSQLLGIEDEYTAFCFDEACCEIIARLKNEEIPKYRTTQNNEYSSFEEFYKQYK